MVEMVAMEYRVSKEMLVNLEKRESRKSRTKGRTFRRISVSSMGS